MKYKLGKKHARKGAIKLALASYVDTHVLPVPPLVFGRVNIGQAWGMLGNDQYSNCVFAGAAHEEMLWKFQIGGIEPVFRVQDVLADYAAVTGFDPNDPNSDQGTDMQEAAAYRKKVGIIDSAGRRHKIDAYVALRGGDLKQLAVAVYLLGVVGVGIQFPRSAAEQFDDVNPKPWTVVEGSPIEGGHYLPIVGRNSAGDFIGVTWGRLHAITAAFLLRYMDEGVAYLSLNALKDNVSWRGFKLDQLRADLTAIPAITA